MWKLPVVGGVGRIAGKGRGFTLIEMCVVVFIFALVLGIAVPNYLTAERTSRAQQCVADLKKIDQAKNQYAVENNLRDGAGVGNASALVPTYLPSWPTPPLDAGSYQANAIGTDPTLNGKSADWYTQHCLGTTVDSSCPF